MSRQKKNIFTTLSRIYFWSGRSIFSLSPDMCQRIPRRKNYKLSILAICIVSRKCQWAAERNVSSVMQECNWANNRNKIPQRVEIISLIAPFLSSHIAPFALN